MKNFRIIFSILFGIIFFIITNSFSQQNKTSGERSRTIDSLLSLIKKDKADTNKVIHLYLLTHECELTGDFEKGLNYGNEAIELADKLNFKKGIANSYNNIGIIYMHQGNYPKTLEYWLKALKIDEELKDKSWIAKRLGNIGIVYMNQGDYPKALDYYFRALNMAKEIGDKKIIESCIGNIGVVYGDQGDYPKALDYYFKALKMHEEQNDKIGIARNLSNIGTVYVEQKDYQNALNYFFKGLNMVEELGDKNGIAIKLGNIGSLYTTIGKFKEAEQYLKKAIKIEESIGALDYLRQYEESLSQLYDTIGQHKLALIHYKKSVALKDTLFSQENKKQLVRKEMNYEFEKKEAITKAVTEEKSRKQYIVLLLVSAVLLLVFVFAGFIFRSLRVTKKQKIVIEQQKQLVEEHQKEIIASITYAKRLQEAILPPIASIKKHFPESFVLYNPKDVVAGDFYWMETIDNTIFIAAADSTGHGVPGAMMSVVCSNALNRAVKEFGLRDTGAILDKVTDLVLETFEKSGTDVKDGMDISLLKIERPSPLSFGEGAGVRLQWSGANNSLWYIQNSNLIEVKPNKQPIGQCDHRKAFTTNKIENFEGSTFYLFTDGYADQFGGEKGKKFMYKRLSENLLSMAQLPLSEQKEALQATFEHWKGNLDQVDDVTIIGIKI